MARRLAEAIPLFERTLADSIQDADIWD